MTILINTIDLSLQIRPLDEDTVRDYAYQLQQDEPELPAVTVALDKETGTSYLVDGFHRLAAHKRNKKYAVIATIIEMTKQEALWYALGANRKNGKRLTREDQRAAIVLALEKFPDASTRTIADQIGCAHTTVGRIQKKSGGALHHLPTSTSEDDSEQTSQSNRVTGRDKKSYAREKSKPKENTELDREEISVESSEVVQSDSGLTHLSDEELDARLRDANANRQYDGEALVEANRRGVKAFNNRVLAGEYDGTQFQKNIEAILEAILPFQKLEEALAGANTIPDLFKSAFELMATKADEKQLQKTMDTVSYALTLTHKTSLQIDMVIAELRDRFVESEVELPSDASSVPSEEGEDNVEA